jgi:hypothetical protein
MEEFKAHQTIPELCLWAAAYFTPVFVFLKPLLHGQNRCKTLHSNAMEANSGHNEKAFIRFAIQKLSFSSRYSFTVHGSSRTWK